MPLSPNTQRYLDELKALNAPPKHKMPILEIRQAAVARASLITNKTAVASVADRRIPAPGRELPARIYTPQGIGPFALLLYFHGGGWASNNLDTHDELCRKLARETGCVVVSADYRLAPEAKFPAAVEDAWAALHWTAEHAAEWNADPKRLIVAGDSSGANLAAVLTLRARDEGSPTIAGQILYYPVTDYYEPGTQSYSSFSEGYGLIRTDMAWFWDLYLPDKSAAENPHASPLKASHFDRLPPALVITSECDILRDEGHAYADRLQASGVPVQYSCYPGLIHGFLILPAFTEETAQAVNESKQWLDRLFADH